MKKIKIFAFFLVFVAFDALAVSPKNLTVLAEPNMVEALTRISRIYSAQNATIISVGFDSSSELINDIEFGEPADIFISAHRYWIDNLKQKGLVDIYNIGHIANDSLVLVTSKDNSRIPSELLTNDVSFMKSLDIINKYRLNLIVDHEGGSLGQYSQQLLRDLKLKDIKVFKKFYEDKTSVANLIVNNPNSYTILLNSQLKDHDEYRILSRLKNQQIFYQALVIAGDNMDMARGFLKFLGTKQAKKIFVESGFIVN